MMACVAVITLNGDGAGGVERSPERGGCCPAWGVNKNQGYRWKEQFLAEAARVLMGWTLQMWLSLPDGYAGLAFLMPLSTG